MRMELSWRCCFSKGRPMNPRHIDRVLTLTITCFVSICRHLGFNGLVGPVPDVLSKLANLMILNFSNNELEGQIPESYRNLTRLERLYIRSL